MHQRQFAFRARPRRTIVCQSSTSLSRVHCMNELQDLIDNNERWADAITKEDPDFFAKLARQQTPDFLWIGRRPRACERDCWHAAGRSVRPPQHGQRGVAHRPQRSPAASDHFLQLRIGNDGSPRTTQLLPNPHSTCTNLLNTALQTAVI
jgi:hypothetical protein